MPGGGKCRAERAACSCISPWNPLTQRVPGARRHRGHDPRRDSHVLWHNLSKIRRRQQPHGLQGDRRFRNRQSPTRCSRGLFFIDSRTSSNSVVADGPRPYASVENSTFLDGVNTEIRDRMIKTAAKKAHSAGQAGHRPRVLPHQGAEAHDQTPPPIPRAADAITPCSAFRRCGGRSL